METCMEVIQRGTLLRVETLPGTRRCDQCSKSHRSCDKVSPSCSRCLELGIPCTRTRPLLHNRLINAWIRSRPQMLYKIVTRIGLGRMERTDLTEAMIKEIEIEPTELLTMPPSLDSLQCILLVQQGILSYPLGQLRYQLYRLATAFTSLLGLHYCSRHSPRWLERRLALNFVSIGPYYSSSGYDAFDSPASWLPVDHRHLNPLFLLAREGGFSNLEEKIHFITSQCLYYNISILTNAFKRYKLALKENTSPSYLSHKIWLSKKCLILNFLWGWHHLSQLVSLPLAPKPLLVKSRMTLALRYHSDCIKLMNIAAYIPQDASLAISPTPNVSRLTPFSRQGLGASFHLIRLLSLLNISLFEIKYIRLLVPACAFLMAHYKVVQEELGNAARIISSLNLARALLNEALKIPFRTLDARASLDLLNFYAKSQKIPQDQ
ncbi:hypothetical protein DSO57_1005118 [Entomophthora muscae]|uniref:Uncharacterized protein n=1 Tax=Entomophthora muscae TaxID=34485 RepID=A0ACC2SAQ3_9FUNG|nr:hypothetical protein DSO57_1005118 [Entomophthora muscae]